MANALARLGLRRGYVVHGSDGLDEITTTGETLVYEIREGAVERRTVAPADFGLPMARLEALRTEGLAGNIRIAHAVLAGEEGPQQDIVLANAAAALMVAGRAGNFREGVQIAKRSIVEGRAAEVLRRLGAFTQRAVG
jgi:anthranilate phosphoribosyltransferase